MVRTNDTLIEARGVQRSFGKDAILRDVDFSIRAGESVSITGHSGSGKTTLLSILALMLKPDAGEVRVAGTETSGLSDAQRSKMRNVFFGYIFQAAHLVGSLTVLDNVLVPALIAGRGRERRDYARSLLASLGLDNRVSHLPHMLSLGQRRRVALARALVLEPPFILADEPTNDLDPRRADQIAEFLLGLPKRGHALVLVTHDRTLARAADIQLFLRDGVLKNVEEVHEEALGGMSVLSSSIQEFGRRPERLGNYEQP
jgi:putative ABC transport system ATP-binding protein